MTEKQGKDVQFVASDGDILTITNDTSEKAKYRNFVPRPDGTSILMDDTEYLKNQIQKTILTSRIKRLNIGKRCFRLQKSRYCKRRVAETAYAGQTM